MIWSAHMTGIEKLITWIKFSDDLRQFKLGGTEKVATATAPTPGERPEAEKPSPSGGTYGN